MKKYLALLLIITLLTPLTASAAATGKLNVFTDVKDAEIYVDGEKVGQENIRGYALAVGEHYVKVMYHGRKAHAELVNIYEDQTKTVVTDNFVDLKTDAPSRGAIDREAARLRESRGNMAFGIYGSTPASGLSFKWWMFEKLGFQVIGFTQQVSKTQVDNQVGYRLLFNLADKVYAEDTITAYAALGYGRWAYINELDANDNVFTNVVEGALGLELRLGREGSTVNTEFGSVFELLLTMLTLGILNTTYISIELGAQNRHYDWQDAERKDDSLTDMKISGGIHYYF